jgi:hypothetical protein
MRGASICGKFRGDGLGLLSKDFENFGGTTAGSPAAKQRAAESHSGTERGAGSDRRPKDTSQATKGGVGRSSTSDNRSNRRRAPSLCLSLGRMLFRPRHSRFPPRDTGRHLEVRFGRILSGHRMACGCPVCGFSDPPASGGLQNLCCVHRHLEPGACRGFPVVGALHCRSPGELSMAFQLLSFSSLAHRGQSGPERRASDTPCRTDRTPGIRRVARAGPNRSRSRISLVACS